MKNTNYGAHHYTIFSAPKHIFLSATSMPFRSLFLEAPFTAVSHLLEAPKFTGTQIKAVIYTRHHNYEIIIKLEGEGKVKSKIVSVSN
jgi:hypothetical protein